MNTITDPANKNYDFGKQFNYGAWVPGSKLTFCNVNWDNNYRDIVKFPLSDGTTLNAYVDANAASDGFTLEKLSYVKPNQPVLINTPFNKVYTYNYLRVSNPVQPVPGSDVQRDLYYFITDVQYVAPNTTAIVVQLDIWQTFGSYATFGNCYVERGHIGIANTKAFDNYGRDYLTVPEGMDVGSEMQVVMKSNTPIMSQDSGSGPNPYNILVVSTVNLVADPGTVTAPSMHSATGGQFANMPSGAIQYLWPSTASFQAWLTSMSDYPWITQGIVSITVVPPITRYGIIAWSPDNKPTVVPTYPWYPRSYATKTNWRNSTDLSNQIPARYRNLRKLWTFPYMAIELTTFTGTPLILKPESWNNADGYLVERVSPAQPAPRIAISPYKYNAKDTQGGDDWVINNAGTTIPVRGDDNGEFMDFATVISNFPTLAIVNNGALSYLAANANGIAFQQQSADWSQQKALQGNQVSYDQSTGAMNLANELTGIGINTDYAQLNIANNATVQKSLLGIAGDVGGGVAGGPAGIAGGLAAGATRAIGSTIDIAASQAAAGARSGSALASTAAQLGQQGLVRDTNKQLADWSARGDYSNSIAAIQAKVRDANLIQPSTSGQVGGDAFNLTNNLVMVSVRWKLIDVASIRRIGEYWLRYGYAVNQFTTLPASLQVMSKFTFWKLSETYLSSSRMPEGFKSVIRGIFEKGVTVWARPEYIGVTDTADNTPLSGVTL